MSRIKSICTAGRAHISITSDMRLPGAGNRIGILLATISLPEPTEGEGEIEMTIVETLLIASSFALCAGVSMVVWSTSLERDSMSCAEFLVLDDVVQPRVLYWTEGYTNRGTHVDSAVDIVVTATLVPVVVDEC
jgi:hypothetical protein